jgi:hypothetical protein
MPVRARGGPAEGPKLVVCAKTNDLEDAEVRPNADHENFCHIRRSIRANRILYCVRFCGSLVGETAGVPGACPAPVCPVAPRSPRQAPDNAVATRTPGTRPAAPRTAVGLISRAESPHDPN